MAAARAPSSPPSTPSAPSPGVGLVLAGSSADAQGHSFGRSEVGALLLAGRVELDTPCWSWGTALVQKGKAVSSHTPLVFMLDVVPSCCCFCPLTRPLGQRPSQTASCAHRVPPSPFVVPSGMRKEPPSLWMLILLAQHLPRVLPGGSKGAEPPWPPLVWPAAAGLHCCSGTAAPSAPALRQEGMTDRD